MVRIFVASEPAPGSVTSKVSGAAHRARSWEVLLLLRFAAVTLERSHDVHLRIAGGAVAAGALNLLQDDGQLGDPETRSAIPLGDERREPSGPRQRVDELRRMAFAAALLAPVLVRLPGADLADGRTDVRVGRSNERIHRGPRTRRSRDRVLRAARPPAARRGRARPAADGRARTTRRSAPPRRHARASARATRGGPR